MDESAIVMNPFVYGRNKPDEGEIYVKISDKVYCGVFVNGIFSFSHGAITLQDDDIWYASPNGTEV